MAPDSSELEKRVEGLDLPSQLKVIINEIEELTKSVAEINRAHATEKQWKKG